MTENEKREYLKQKEQMEYERIEEQRRQQAMRTDRLSEITENTPRYHAATTKNIILSLIFPFICIVISIYIACNFNFLYENKLYAVIVNIKMIISIVVFFIIIGDKVNLSKYNFFMLASVIVTLMIVFGIVVCTDGFKWSFEISQNIVICVIIAFQSFCFITVGENLKDNIFLILCNPILYLEPFLSSMIFFNFTISI